MKGKNTFHKIKNYRKIIGAYGEELAKKYLIKYNYRIIAQNIKTSYKEIDIIAKQNDKLVFVEVKTRTTLKYGQADEAISRKKISNLRKAIGIYLDRSNKEKYKNIQLDLIAIDINKENKTANIKHYKEII